MKLIKRLFLLILIAVSSFYIYKFFFKNEGLKPISVIPENAFLIVEAERAIPAWNELSSNNIWQQFKTNKLLGNASENIHKVDSIFKEHNNLLKIFSSTNIAVSFHAINKNDFDFLLVVDLNKASGISLFKNKLPSLVDSEYAIGKRDYNQQEIIELHSMKDDDVIYLSFIDNLVLLSYHFLVLESAIDKMNHEVIGKDFDFLLVKKYNKNDGVVKLYINHSYLNNFFNIQSGTNFSSSLLYSLNYSGFNLYLSDHLLEFSGNSSIDNNTDSYLHILQQSGKGSITVQEILPKKVCYMANIGCESFPDFYNETINTLKNSPEDYKEYKENISKIEKLLDIDLKKNFINWIDDEIAIAQIMPVKSYEQLQLAVILKAKSIRTAKKNLAFITGQIKKKTPVKFKEIDYNSYPINYLSVKGFFRPILGKMLSKFEKPYFTYIEDFVVFSNKPQTLKNIIDDYLKKETLENSAEFYNFMKHFSTESNIFLYINPPVLVRSIKPFVNQNQKKIIEQNIDIINSIPRLGVQLYNEKNRFNSKLTAEFMPESEIEFTINDSEGILPFEELIDTINNLNKDSIITETDIADSLLLFKITDIVINDLDSRIQEIHWKNGRLKASVELEEGIMHGEYKEFYESGEQKLRGKFDNGIKTGTWKAFDKNGKLIEKRNFNN